MIGPGLPAAGYRRYALALLIVMSISHASGAADRILVVTATAGFEHDSIPTAEEVIGGIGEATKWFDVVFARTEEEAVEALSLDRLREVRVVIFANTTGEIAVSRRDGLLHWISEGGSFIGVHSASDTWHESPAYISALGGEFDTHPDQTIAEIVVEDREHASTAPLDSPRPLFEEYYLFRNHDPERVRLLLSLHASPVDGLPGLFPLAWAREHGQGRVFYTALGHRIDVWTNEWFQQHLTGAIAWALRRDEIPRRRPARRTLE